MKYNAIAKQIVSVIATFVIFSFCIFSARAEFTCSIDVPAGAVGASRTATVTYSNNGASAIAAPYVRIEAGDNAYVRFSESDAWSKSVEFLATSGQTPASSLRAGEEIKLPVFVYTATQHAQVTFSYTQSSAEAFPWSDIGASLKPSYVSDTAWTYALATLKSRFGTTWNSYLSRLRANADYLAENARPVRRVDRLLQIEINNALGVDCILPVLASVTDAARSARGMGLSFVRSYSSAMYGRFTSGILGYGWTDNLSTCAELSTDGKTLVFRVPGGGSYSFTKATGSWQPEDARDKTVLTESSSAYALTYQSGTVQTFAKSNMRTSSIADNCGNTLTFTWSGTTLQKISHTDGQSLTFAYSGGRISSVTDDCGRKTAYTYSNSLLTKVTAPDGLETRYEYRSSDGTAATRALSRIVYPDGTTREFSYDTSSGLVSAISSNGGKERTTLSRDGGVVVLTGPDGAKTTVKTGVSGETLETADALGGVSAKGYTEDGLLKSVVSPSGLTGAISHDALGRVSKSVSAAGTATAFAYEETFGNLKMVTDAKNNSVTYGYDAKGRGTSVTFADGSASKLEYNNRGDVVKSINRRGQSVVYTYDVKGRLTKKVWSTGRTFTYSYDAHGNVTTATDSETGTVAMQYDSADRLTKITYPAGRGFTFVYDSCGRLATRTSHDGAVEQFAYDASGRLSSVRDGSGALYLQNTYDATTGRLSKQVNGNGTSVSYLYDKLGRVVSIEHCDAEGKIAESLQYCYDADGRCIRASSLLGEERYGYDKDGQLISVRYPESPSEAFAYDAVGNRTTANGATYTVNNLNQYTAISAGLGSSAAAITYDKDGNMTSLTDSNGTTTYSYDVLNRLVAVSNPAAGIDWSCRYDVFGNRVSVTDNGVTTERTYLQGSLPSVAAEYVNGQLKERHIVVGAVRVADLTSNNSASTAKYYHADLIGSTRLVTDGNGDIVNRCAYKAFGETRIGEESVCGYVGTLGVETDSTGLLFMRNRYYSPSLGRFIQMDPIGQNSGDVNVYRYCNNNGLQGVDPDGFEVLENIALMFDVDMTDPNAAPGLLGPSVTVAASIVSSDSVAKMAERGTVALLVKETPSTALGVSYSNLGRKLVQVPASAVNKAGIVKSGVKGLGKAGTVWAWGESAYYNLYKKFDVRQFLADGVTGMYKGWFQIGCFAGYWATMGGIKIYKWLKPDKTIVVNVTSAGGSASINPSEIDDFIMSGDYSKGVTISGSFTISFEWVVQVNPEQDYPIPFAYYYFYVDGVSQGSEEMRYTDANGVARWTESVTVIGEETHSLRWEMKLLTSLPVSYRVQNIKIVRTSRNLAASVRSNVPLAMDDSMSNEDAQSMRAVSRMALAAESNEEKSPRLCCYERYVAVKGLAYTFALSADEDASISVSGLPSGFSFADGRISGKASAVGTTTMTITARGSSGTTIKNVEFIVTEEPGDFGPIVSFMSLPDIRPYVASGWSAPLAVSASANSTQGSTLFLDTDSLYVSWLIDCGNVNAEGRFYTCLYVDGVLKYSWYTEGLRRDYYTNVIGYSLGTLSAGTHKVKIVTDATGVVAESDEANNTYETTITVVRDYFPDLAVSSLSVSRTSLTVSDSVTVHWWVDSYGDPAADKSKIAFLTYKYDTASEEYTLVKTEWMDCLPLATGGRQEFTKIIKGKSLVEGVYVFAVVADGTEIFAERNEDDNIKLVAVSVSKDAATSSKSSVDWQFNKIKGEADSFFLSASSDMKKKTTSFNVGQTIYMRCCWWNAKKSDVYGKMRCSIYLDGSEKMRGELDSIEKNYYKFFSNNTPDFLQNLPAGSYTLTAVLDSEEDWLETNEKNNVKTISFTVVGKPTIASELTYCCAINEPVSWPVTIYGKATVKGLPSGLKYSNGTISGKATKAGTYTVTFSASNAAGSSTKTITIVVENPGFVVTCSGKTNGTSLRDVASGDTIDLCVGVKQEFSLSAVPGKTGMENSAVSSISAKGLPSGLKLSSGVISGVPTKPGSYLATITFKNKYGWTAVFNLKFVVTALPDWAIGTFNGGGDSGQVSLTVAKTGKLSGKYLSEGLTWNLAATSFDSYEDDVYRATLVGKSGKLVITNEIGVACDAIGGFAESLDYIAFQNNWKLEPWKTVGKPLAKADVFEYEDSASVGGEAAPGVITLKFASSGAVTAKGSFVTGVNAKTGKDIVYSASGSAVLLPQTMPDENGAFEGVVFVYFPPKAGKFDGYVRCVTVRWTGEAWEVVE